MYARHKTCRYHRAALVLVPAAAHCLPWLVPVLLCCAGVSLAANAVVDHLLGDRLASPLGGALGVLLVAAGVTLCSLAQHRAS